MATELFIAKNQYWLASENPITLSEWLSLCAADPSLRVQDELSAVNPKTGEEIKINSPGYAFFNHPVAGENFAFEYRNGKIAARYDEEIIPKAKELAAKLGATVQDEEGEPVEPSLPR